MLLLLLLGLLSVLIFVCLFGVGLWGFFVSFCSRTAVPLPAAGLQWSKAVSRGSGRPPTRLPWPRPLLRSLGSLWLPSAEVRSAGAALPLVPAASLLEQLEDVHSPAAISPTLQCQPSTVSGETAALSLTAPG